MKAIVIKPKSPQQARKLNAILREMGISATRVEMEQLEDIGLGLMMKEANRKQTVSRSTVMRKLK